MIPHHPQPVYSTAYPAHIPNTRQASTEMPDGCELEVLANTASQEYFELKNSAASELTELEAWRRNANGPARRNNAMAETFLQVFTPPPTYNPNPNAWTAMAFDHWYQQQQQQQQPLMAQPQIGGGHHHPCYAASPTSPAPGQNFDNMYGHQDNGHRAAYPSSVSSNDPLLTQEEADIKRLRNTAASARFRAKKKRREASLERNAHEKKTKLESLETRIRDLEAENQWLKDLIMEKNAVRTARLERKGYEQKDGVSTQ